MISSGPTTDKLGGNVVPLCSSSGESQSETCQNAINYIDRYSTWPPQSVCADVSYAC